MSLSRTIPSSDMAARLLGSAGLCLGVCLFVLGLSAAPALAMNGKNGEAESQIQVEPIGRASNPVPPVRVVEVVVVWGFRFRATLHNTRSASLRAGYGELINRSECLTSICGFVVTQEGRQWRASNTLAATDAELLQKQKDMERDGTTLVIVHPTGTRRSVPQF